MNMEQRDLTEKEQHKILFLQLVAMLTTSAMQQMGKLVNPATGQTEIHLDAAETSIDLLGMLQAKTKGHLDDDEQRALADSLHTLRLNYWETCQAQAQSTSQPRTSPQETTADSTEEKRPKFQKKYG